MPDIYSQKYYILLSQLSYFGSVIQIFVPFDPPALLDMVFLYGHLHVRKFPLQLCIRAFCILRQRCVLAWTEMCRSFSHGISLFSFSVTAL